MYLQSKDYFCHNFLQIFNIAKKFIKIPPIYKKNNTKNMQRPYYFFKPRYEEEKGYYLHQYFSERFIGKCLEFLSSFADQSLNDQTHGQLKYMSQLVFYEYKESFNKLSLAKNNKWTK